MIPARFLTNPDDVSTLVSALRLDKKLSSTSSLKEAAGATTWSHESEPYCGHLHPPGSRAFLECYVRHWTFSLYHAVGTCSMGTVTDNR